MLGTESQLLKTDFIDEKAQLSLDQLERGACGAGATCTATVNTGIASSIILDTIIARDIQLVVLGTRSAHEFEHLVVGFTAEAIFSKVPFPVFTVVPQVRDTSETIQPTGLVIFSTGFQVTTLHAIDDAAFFCKLMETTPSLPACTSSYT